MRAARLSGTFAAAVVINLFRRWKVQSGSSELRLLRSPKVKGLSRLWNGNGWRLFAAISPDYDFLVNRNCGDARPRLKNRPTSLAEFVVSKSHTHTHTNTTIRSTNEQWTITRMKSTSKCVLFASKKRNEKKKREESITMNERISAIQSPFNVCRKMSRGYFIHVRVYWNWPHFFLFVSFRSFVRSSSAASPERIDLNKIFTLPPSFPPSFSPDSSAALVSVRVVFSVFSLSPVVGC